MKKSEANQQWRSLPWLLALVASPLLAGSVVPESISLVSLGIGASLVAWGLLPSTLPSRELRKTWGWLGFCAFILLLYLVPLPSGLVEWISPERARLAREFPIPSSEAGPSNPWIPLSTSSASTLNRAWILILALACFFLARRSAHSRGAEILMVTTVVTGLALQCAGVIDFKLNQGKSILGLWPLSGHNAFGTFANRNHFANWTAMAILFLLGWIFKSFHTADPLSQGRHARRSNPGKWLVAGIVCGGLAMLVLSGSRAGLLAFLCGGVAWILLLGIKGGSRKALTLSGIFLVLLCWVTFVLGDYFFTRMSTLTSDLVQDYPKKDFALETVKLSSSFFWTGIGPGSFLPVYNHYKSVQLDKKVLHAENEYAEFLLEMGWPLFLLIVGMFLYWFKRMGSDYFSIGRHDSPLYSGALAAIICFAIHALVEFVTRVPANLFLVASMMGLVTGLHDKHKNLVSSPISRSPAWMTVIGGLAIILIGALQARAFVPWWSGQGINEHTDPDKARVMLEKSIELWPWGYHDRHLQYATLTARSNQNLSSEASFRMSEKVQIILQQGLSTDPLNWRLRLEDLRVLLLLEGVTPKAMNEAERIIKLNPGYFDLRLNLARVFSEAEPQFALDILKGIEMSHVRNPRAVIDLTWEIEPNASKLWEVTPNTREGLLALSEFATQKNMTRLAEQALMKLPNKVDKIELASRFIRIGRAEKALELLSEVPQGREADLIRAQASAQLGQHSETIRFAESFILKSSLSDTLLKTPSTLEIPESILETMMVSDLLVLLKRYPNNIGLLWHLHQAYIRLQLFNEAAATVLKAAERVAIEEKKRESSGFN